MAQVGVHRHPDAPWSLRLFQRVLLNWTYHYLTYDLGLRAIVGPRRRPGSAAGGDC